MKIKIFERKHENIKKFKKKYEKIISMYEKETGKTAIFGNKFTGRFMHWLREGKYKNK